MSGDIEVTLSRLQWSKMKGSPIIEIIFGGLNPVISWTNQCTLWALGPNRRFFLSGASALISEYSYISIAFIEVILSYYLHPSMADACLLIRFILMNKFGEERYILGPAQFMGLLCSVNPVPVILKGNMLKFIMFYKVNSNSGSYCYYHWIIFFWVLHWFLMRGSFSLIKPYQVPAMALNQGNDHCSAWTYLSIKRAGTSTSHSQNPNNNNPPAILPLLNGLSWNSIDSP